MERGNRVGPKRETNPGLEKKSETPTGVQKYHQTMGLKSLHIGYLYKSKVEI